MKCQRCGIGRLMREDEGYTCLMCGARVEDKPTPPLDISPKMDALFPIPPRKVVRRA